MAFELIPLEPLTNDEFGEMNDGEGDEVSEV